MQDRAIKVPQAGCPDLQPDPARRAHTRPRPRTNTSPREPSQRLGAGKGAGCGKAPLAQRAHRAACTSNRRQLCSARAGTWPRHAAIGTSGPHMAGHYLRPQW
eukprot:11912110-Alexandrium_andersonii.AAC.1